MVDRRKVVVIASLAIIVIGTLYYFIGSSMRQYVIINDPNLKALVNKSKLPRISVRTNAISNGWILRDFTCYGKSMPPAIEWSNYDDAPCYAVIVFDPDAKIGTFFHLFEILDKEGRPVEIFYNSAMRKGWFPVCPPKGEVHRYYFVVIALDTCKVKGKNLTDFLTEHALAIGYVVGKFGVKG